MLANMLPALETTLRAPLRLWRHPNGKPVYLIAIALAALWANWLFVSAIAIIAAYHAYVLFDD